MAVRTSAAYTPEMEASVQRAAPTTGSNVTVLQTKLGNLYVLVNPSGALLALTMTLPAGDFNGQTITIAFTQPITALSLSGFPVIGALTAAVAGGFAKYLWTADNSTWNRVG